MKYFSHICMRFLFYNLKVDSPIELFSVYKIDNMISS